MFEYETIQVFSNALSMGIQREVHVEHKDIFGVCKEAKCQVQMGQETVKTINAKTDTVTLTQVYFPPPPNPKSRPNLGATNTESVLTSLHHHAS